MTSSAFSDSRSERSRRTCLHLVPPKVRIVTQVTAGLLCIYGQIREKKFSVHHKVGEFTDSRGHFNPPEGTVLAKRYRVLNIICCRGQSAVLFRAQDLMRENITVVIKALHDQSTYFAVAIQEAETLRRLTCADPFDFSHTVRLLNTFLYDRHVCLVFEELDPRPITVVLSSLQLKHAQKLKILRKLTLQLLQVVGFLRQNNTIHADLKPENILLENACDFSSLRVIDFGNAIYHVHHEMSLYYDDFELQTLLYRAPEVFFGIPFGMEIDMWSLGSVLAEIYLEKPLIYGTNKQEMVQSMFDLLGPLPQHVFRHGKFYEQLKQFTERDADQNNVTLRLMKVFQMQFQPDYCFTDLLAGLLHYDPDKRLTPLEAAQHQFLAPEMCLSYLMPPFGAMKQASVSTIFISAEEYKEAPLIAPEIRRQNPSSQDLLRMGTRYKHTDSSVSPLGLGRNHAETVSQNLSSTGAIQEFTGLHSVDSFISLASSSQKHSDKISNISVHPSLKTDCNSQGSPACISQSDTTAPLTSSISFPRRCCMQESVDSITSLLFPGPEVVSQETLEAEIAPTHNNNGVKTVRKSSGEHSACISSASIYSPDTTFQVGRSCFVDHSPLYSNALSNLNAEKDINKSVSSVSSNALSVLDANKIIHKLDLLMSSNAVTILDADSTFYQPNLTESSKTVPVLDADSTFYQPNLTESSKAVPVLDADNPFYQPDLTELSNDVPDQNADKEIHKLDLPMHANTLPFLDIEKNNHKSQYRPHTEHAYEDSEDVGTSEENGLNYSVLFDSNLNSLFPISTLQDACTVTATQKNFEMNPHKLEKHHSDITTPMTVIDSDDVKKLVAENEHEPVAAVETQGHISCADNLDSHSSRQCCSDKSACSLPKDCVRWNSFETNTSTCDMKNQKTILDEYETSEVLIIEMVCPEKSSEKDRMEETVDKRNNTFISFPLKSPPFSKQRAHWGRMDISAKEEAIFRDGKRKQLLENKLPRSQCKKISSSEVTSFKSSHEKEIPSCSLQETQTRFYSASILSGKLQEETTRFHTAGMVSNPKTESSADALSFYNNHPQEVVTFDSDSDDQPFYQFIQDFISATCQASPEPKRKSPHLGNCPLKSAPSITSSSDVKRVSGVSKQAQICVPQYSNGMTQLYSNGQTSGLKISHSEHENSLEEMCKISNELGFDSSPTHGALDKRSTNAVCFDTNSRKDNSLKECGSIFTVHGSANAPEEENTQLPKDESLKCVDNKNARPLLTNKSVKYSDATLTKVIHEGEHCGTSCDNPDADSYVAMCDRAAIKSDRNSLTWKAGESKTKCSVPFCVSKNRKNKPPRVGNDQIFAKKRRVLTARERPSSSPEVLTGVRHSKAIHLKHCHKILVHGNISEGKLNCEKVGSIDMGLLKSSNCHPPSIRKCNRTSNPQNNTLKIQQSCVGNRFFQQKSKILTSSLRSLENRSSDVEVVCSREIKSMAQSENDLQVKLKGNSTSKEKAPISHYLFPPVCQSLSRYTNDFKSSESLGRNMNQKTTKSPDCTKLEVLSHLPHSHLDSLSVKENNSEESVLQGDIIPDEEKYFSQENSSVTFVEDCHLTGNSFSRDMNTVLSSTSEMPSYQNCCSELGITEMAEINNTSSSNLDDVSDDDVVLLM